MSTGAGLTFLGLMIFGSTAMVVEALQEKWKVGKKWRNK